MANISNIELTKRLEAALLEVARQKNLKEMYINREKATREELERLRRASDPETLITMRIATEARSTIKTKKKKQLQKDHEDLKVSQILSQQKFAAQLQVERDLNEALRREIVQLKASQSNLRDTEDVEATSNLMAEKDATIQQMEEEINSLKTLACETQKSFQKQVKDLRGQLDEERSTSCSHLEKIRQLHDELSTSKKELSDQKKLSSEEQLRVEEEKRTLTEQLEATKKLMAQRVEELTTKLEAQTTQMVSLQEQVEKTELLRDTNTNLEKELQKAEERETASQKHVENLKIKVRTHMDNEEELFNKLQALQEVLQKEEQKNALLLETIKSKEQEEISLKEKEALEKPAEELKPQLQTAESLQEKKGSEDGKSRHSKKKRWWRWKK